MISSKRTNQGGSILTFIIAAVVLAFGVIGTAYFVKQRGEQVRKEQAIVQADKLAKQEDSKKQAAATSSSSENNGKTNTDTTAVAAVASAAPASTATPSTPQSSDEQAALPTTGPESGIGQVLAIGLLVASGTAYISSRRGLNRSL